MARKERGVHIRFGETLDEKAEMGEGLGAAEVDFRYLGLRLRKPSVENLHMDSSPRLKNNGRVKMHYDPGFKP